MPRSDLVTTMLDQRRASGGPRPTDAEIAESCRRHEEREIDAALARLSDPMRRDLLRCYVSSWERSEEHPSGTPVSLVTGRHLERRGLVRHVDWRRESASNTVRLWLPTELGSLVARDLRRRLGAGRAQRLAGRNWAFAAAAWLALACSSEVETGASSPTSTSATTSTTSVSVGGGGTGGVAGDGGAAELGGGGTGGEGGAGCIPAGVPCAVGVAVCCEAAAVCCPGAQPSMGTCLVNFCDGTGGAGGAQ